MSRKRWVVLLAVAVGCVVAGFIAYYIINAINAIASYDPYKAAVQATEQLLDYAQEHSIGPLPQDELPSYLWVGDNCWELLQEAMLQNSGRHSLTARDNGEPFRPVDDILVRVDFADGRQIDVYFYEGGLAGCHSVFNE